MDRDRFDALAKLLASSGSRRLTLGALLGLSLGGGELADLLAKRGKGQHKGLGEKGVQEAGRPGAAHKAHHQHKHTQRHRRKKRNRHDRGHGKSPGLGSGECAADGHACTQSSDCCSQNCFNFVCAERVNFCGNTTCQPAAAGCCAVGGCCQPPANQCNPGGECCAPNCTGKQCGPDGCGGDGTCGDCADGFTCTEDGQCVCTLQPVGGPCSTNGDCCSGNCCADQCCDAGGSCCMGDCCPPPNTQCCNDECCFPGNTCCGQNGDICCDEPLFGFCNGFQCVPCFPGCVSGQRCSATGECICDATTCPDGCCSGGPGNPGTCEPKQPGQPCPCTPQNCPSGCCVGSVCHTLSGAQFCGTGGATCDTCTAQEQCIAGKCCLQECVSGQCGPISDGCGGTVECGQCEVGATPSCKDGVCASCPATCPNVRYCLNLVNGATVCCNDVNIDCAAGSCSSDSDCNQGEFCMTSYSTSTGGTSPNETFTNLCGAPAGVCGSC